MSATITTIPAIPLALKPAKLHLTADTGNFVRVWCTDAPRDSKLKGLLLESGAARVAVVSGDVGAKPEFTPDKGGAYVFLVEEIQRGATNYGGGYENDPNAAPAETVLHSQNQTVFFASALIQRLGVVPDTAELLLYVQDSTIVQTTGPDHKIVSPALTKVTTPKARLASEALDVRAAVAALAGQTVSAALGDVGDVIADLIDSFEGHRTQSGVHDDDDDENIVAPGQSNPAPTTTEAQKKALGDLRRKLDQHMRNEDPTAEPPDPTGTGSADYHAGVDGPNAMLPVSPSDQNSIVIAAADTWRSLAGHLANDEVHDAADTANTPDDLPPLLELHRAFLVALADHGVAAPPNEHPGKAVLVHAGFSEL